MRCDRHIKGISEFKVKFGKALSSFEVLVDVYCSGNISDRKSTTRYIIFLRDSPVIYFSRKQHLVSESSTKAEFISGPEACKEGLWLDQLMYEIENTQKRQCMIYEDNQGCVSMTKNE